MRVAMATGRLEVRVVKAAVAKAAATQGVMDGVMDEVMDARMEELTGADRGAVSKGHPAVAETVGVEAVAARGLTTQIRCGQTDHPPQATAAIAHRVVAAEAEAARVSSAVTRTGITTVVIARVPAIPNPIQ